MEERRLNEGSGVKVSNNDSSTSLEVIEFCFKKIIKLLAKRVLNNAWSA